MAVHAPGWRPDLEHATYGKTDVYSSDDSKHVRHDLPINIDELEQHRRELLGFKTTTHEELVNQHLAKLAEAGYETDDRNTGN